MALHPRIDALLLMLQQGWGPNSWHGTALKGALRGVTPAMAEWRPGPGRHNIRELVVHMAYWKYACTRRLLGSPEGKFARGGSNWIPVPDRSAAGLRADIALLNRQHADLVAAVRRFPASRLNRKEKSRFSHAEWIAGAAAHDLYHTGQIQLIKKMFRHRAR